MALCRIEVIAGFFMRNEAPFKNFPISSWASASRWLRGVQRRLPIRIEEFLQIGDDLWRDVPLASVSDCILPVIYGHEFVPVMPKEQPTYRPAAIDGNYLVERPKFPCPRCPSVFSHKNNLYYHSKFECGQSPRFNCPYCAYRTKHVSNVRAHVRRKHPGNKVYAIDVCKVDS